MTTLQGNGFPFFSLLLACVSGHYTTTENDKFFSFIATFDLHVPVSCVHYTVYSHVAWCIQYTLSENNNGTPCCNSEMVCNYVHCEFVVAIAYKRKNYHDC